MRQLQALTLSALVFALHALPASAATTTCNASLEIKVAPVPGMQPLRYRKGRFAKDESSYTLTYTVVEGSGEPIERVIQVDVAAKRASVQAADGAVKSLDYDRLSKIKFSDVALSAEGLASLVLIKDRLKEGAKFLKNDNFSGEPVQTYFFRESKSVYGEILFSPIYGVPLKLDVFDNKNHSRRYVTLSNVSR